MPYLYIIEQLKNHISKILYKLNKLIFFNKSYEDAKVLVLNYLG